MIASSLQIWLLCALLEFISTTINLSMVSLNDVTFCSNGYTLQRTEGTRKSKLIEFGHTRCIGRSAGADMMGY